MFELFEMLENMFVGEYFDRKTKRTYSSSLAGRVYGVLFRWPLLTVIAMVVVLCLVRYQMAYTPDEPTWQIWLNVIVSFNTVLGPIAALIIFVVALAMLQLFESFAKHLASLLLYGEIFEEDTTNYGGLEMMVDFLMEPLPEKK